MDGTIFTSKWEGEMVAYNFESLDKLLDDLWERVDALRG